MIYNSGMPDLDPLNRCVVHLTMLSKIDGNTQKISVGTGVVFKQPKAQSYFLATAWHNLAGREPDTLKCKDIHHLALPNYVLIEGHRFHLELPLYDQSNDAAGDNPLYWRHPDLEQGGGQHYDVTVLPILARGPFHETSTMHESFFDPHLNNALSISVSQTCFIIGYPEGLVDNSSANYGPLPIWKVGHIASEPSINFRGEPLLLVDATTRRGMSGAPVMVRGITRAGRSAFRFLGIYVGRYTIKSEAEAGKYIEDSAIGRVYKPEIIHSILKVGASHNRPIPWTGQKS